MFAGSALREVTASIRGPTQIDPPHSRIPRCTQHIVTPLQSPTFLSSLVLSCRLSWVSNDGTRRSTYTSRVRLHTRHASPLRMGQTISGSARQSVKVFVLHGFLETHILVLCRRQRQHSHQNGQNSEFAVEMTLGGTYSGTFAEDSCPSHRAWKPAPNAGSHISTATTAAGC